MTRDEAIQVAINVEFPPGTYEILDAASVEPTIRHAKRSAALFIDRMVKFGLLKLDEPKTEENEAMGLAYLLFRQGVDYRGAAKTLAEKGFKIVKA